MGSRESFSTWESLENIYVLMEIVSQEGKTGDVGESGHKGRSTVMKRQVIFDKRKGRDGYTCLVNPCKVIIRMQCLQPDSPD